MSVNVQCSSLKPKHSNTMVFFLVKIPLCKVQKDNRKEDDKYEQCYYCPAKLKGHYGRHYTSKHADAPELMKYFMLERSTTESEKAFQSRKTNIILKLRMLGNFRHNAQVPSEISILFVSVGMGIKY